VSKPSRREKRALDDVLWAIARYKRIRNQRVMRDELLSIEDEVKGITAILDRLGVQQ